MYFTVIVGFLKSLLYIKFRQNEQKIAIFFRKHIPLAKSGRYTKHGRWEN